MNIDQYRRVKDPLDRALRLATDAHQGQKSFRGRPYILHPIRVMEQLDTDEERIVALLHDVVEDTNVTVEKIAALFGEEVAVAITLLTHQPNEPYEDYIGAVALSPLATKVKLADLQDNLRVERLPKVTEAAVQRLIRYARAQRRLLPAQRENG